MKIYLYSPETGIYQGEDFANGCSMKQTYRGLPVGCTTIAPPACGPGEVPVFHEAEKRWEIMPVKGD